MIPSGCPARRLTGSGRPPRLASIIRGPSAAWSSVPYRRFDTLRSSSPAQPYFYHIPAPFGSPAFTLCMSAARLARRGVAKPWDAICKKQDARRRRTRPVSPSVASSTRRKRPQQTSHKTRMAWAVTCHLPPAHPFLLLVLSLPTTIRRGVSVLMQCFPLAGWLLSRLQLG
jgi:hypothetical protein